jgi:hypothetical protein
VATTVRRRLVADAVMSEPCPSIELAGFDGVVQRLVVAFVLIGVRLRELDERAVEAVAVAGLVVLAAVVPSFPRALVANAFLLIRQDPRRIPRTPTRTPPGGAR